MIKEASITGSDAMLASPRRGCLNPFLVIFWGLCNIINWMFKPSALQLENATLRRQIESQKVKLQERLHNNVDLEKLNSNLNATVMALQSEGEKMQNILALQDEKISRGNEQIADQKECAKRIKKELKSIKKENSELELQLKKQKVFMESKTSAWICTIDKRNQKNLSLEAQLKKQYHLVERQMRNIMALEMGLGQLQAINKGLRSEKEELKKSCTRLEKENRQLKDVLNCLVSEKRN